MAFDVFISYSTKDVTTAKAACAALEAEKVRCWMAPRDISPGARWGAAIVQAIDHCRVMVLIFSGNANESRQVFNEVNRAFSKGVTVVPLRIEDVMPVDDLAYYLDTVHWLDALNPPLERGLSHLAATVRSLLATAELPTPGGEAALDATTAALAQDVARAEDERRLQASEVERVAAQKVRRDIDEAETQRGAEATQRQKMADARQHAEEEARRRQAETETRQRREGEQASAQAGRVATAQTRLQRLLRLSSLALLIVGIAQLGVLVIGDNLHFYSYLGLDTCADIASWRSRGICGPDMFTWRTKLFFADAIVAILTAVVVLRWRWSYVWVIFGFVGLIVSLYLSAYTYWYFNIYSPGRVVFNHGTAIFEMYIGLIFLVAAAFAAVLISNAAKALRRSPA